jgi:hypothetical protein
MPFLTELNDVWVVRDGKMIADGDAKTIDAMLKTELVELKQGNWAILYRHRDRTLGLGVSAKRKARWRSKTITSP